MLIRAMTIAIIAGTTALAATSQTHAETTHLCGGIGLEEQAAEIRTPHTLKIEYADTSGHYLGDIRTRIEAQDGTTVVDVHCDGPWLLANLLAGSYNHLDAFTKALAALPAE